MKNKVLNKDIILTVLLFCLGQFSVLPLNISALIIFIISTLLAFLIFKNNKILENNIVLFFSILASLFCLFSTILIFTEFFKSFVIGYLPKILIALIFLIISIFVGFKKQTIINKLATLFGSMSLFFFTLIFLLSLKEIELSNFKALRLNNQSLLYLGPIISVFLLPLYLKSCAKESLKVPSVIGILSSLLVNILLSFLPILVFGEKLYSGFDYPIFYLVSSISVGKLFTRIDAFLYFFVFSVFIIKTAVLVNIIKESLAKVIKIPALKN